MQDEAFGGRTAGVVARACAQCPVGKTVHFRGRIFSKMKNNFKNRRVCVWKRSGMGWGGEVPGRGSRRGFKAPGLALPLGGRRALSAPKAFVRGPPLT